MHKISKSRKFWNHEITKSRKTFELLQAEKCKSMVDLHRSFQTTHPWGYGMDKVSQRGWISHIPGGRKPQQGLLFPFSDHSLSQRGMGWCHVPSAWQTAVKDTSFWWPYMGEKNICWLYRAFNSSPTLKYYSVCPSFHCCPIFAPLQSVPVAISSCLPSSLYLLQATHSSYQAKTYQQPATIKPQSVRCYPALA